MIVRKISAAILFLIIPILLPAAVNNAVRVDMEGYRPSDKKYVLLVGATQTAFTVKRVSDNVTVYSGTFGTAVADAASGDSVKSGDFSSVTTDGDYYVQVTGLGESYNFRINNDVYKDAFITAMRGLYGQRCGAAVTLTHRGTTFAHPACHLNDGTYDGSTGLSGNKNMTGGWHDAGDYGKYALNCGVTMGNMLLMFERYKTNIELINLGLPYSGGALPDVLVEIKYNLDFMLKMQHTTGAVFHKIANGFPQGIMPQDDGGTRYIFEPSSCATGDLAAVMAIAYRVFLPYNAAYANQCLTAAQNAWAYLQANPNIVPAGGFTGGLGGVYGDTDDRDERLWAAVELFNSTGTASYNTYVVARYADRAIPLISANGDDWKELHPIAYYSYILSPQASVNAAVVNAMKTAFQAHVNTFRTRALSTNGYKYVLNSGDYYWGSNSVALNRCTRLLMAADIFADNTYREAAVESIHYMLGRNPMNKSYMTYVGEVYTNQPHHQPSIADGITPPWPGLLAGGPNQYDDTGPAPAKCYADDSGNYTSNEVAINWSSAFCFVLAGFISPPPPTPTPTATITGTPPTSTITPTFTVTPTFMAIRVNCAGPLYTDGGGLTWAADKVYGAAPSWGFTIAGNTNTRVNAIAGTTDDTLFQTERWNAALAYAFDIANGTYSVRLRFADTYAGTASVGARRFNVLLEGTQVLTNFDIYALVGTNTATDQIFIVTVTDGQLNVNLAQGLSDSPLINAIEIITYYPPSTHTFTHSPTRTVSATITRTRTISPTYTATITGTPPTQTFTQTPSPTATAAPIRIDCGGPGATTGGNIWIADAYFAGGNTGNTADPTGLTTDDVLYQTERYGTFSYNIPVTDGTYSVTLKFSEIYFNVAGARLFDVSIEGALVLDNLDVYAMAGHDNAYDRSFTAVVSDGVLNITFTGVLDNAIIDAIQVLPVAPTPTRTYTASATFTRTVSSTFTSTFTSTGTRTYTYTPTVTMTDTAIFTATNTVTRTSTTGSTPSFTVTSIATGTFTSTAPATPANTFTRTQTVSSSATNTPVNTSTQLMPSHTFTAVLTVTFTPSRSTTMTSTLTLTQTFTVTSSRTYTPTFTSTSTATATPTFTNTVYQSPTNTPSVTMSCTGTPPTQTNTPTITLTYTATLTHTNTPVDTATLTATNSPQATLSFTRTHTPVNTATLTWTLTPQNTHTTTLTVTPVNTATLTRTITPVNTATCTHTATPSNTAIPSIPTPTQTAIATIGTVHVYPNPCNPVFDDLTLAFNLDFPAVSARFEVYTVSSRKIRSLNLGACPAGVNRPVVQKNEIKSLAAGSYYYVIISQHHDGTQTRTKIGTLLIAR